MKNLFILLLFLPVETISQWRQNPSVYLGLKTNTERITSIFAMAGKRNYFTYEVGYNFPRDNTIIHPRYDDRQISIWGHKKQADIEKTLYWSTGTGYRFKRYGANVAVCMYRTNVFRQYYDQTLCFSPTGYYSFLYERKGFVTLKGGLNANIKKFNVGYEMDVRRKTSFFSFSVKI